jgi:hypothetical protein
MRERFPQVLADKATNLSRISQRKSQDCGAVRALTSARSSIVSGWASIICRLTTAPSDSLDSRTASSSRRLIRATSAPQRHRGTNHKVRLAPD